MGEVGAAEETSEDVSGRDWRVAVEVEAVASGQPLQVDVGGRVVVIGRLDGRFYAVDDRCPHAGASLGLGTLDRGRLVCSVHGWKFDVFSGECELFGAQVATYPVRVIGGKLEIRLDISRPKQIS
jgi:nitrite reductase/ring-hydroxylating ferredoxin subunit